MNNALVYLVVRSFINRLRFMASRLREPRYLLPFLVFAGYLLLTASTAFIPRRGGQEVMPDFDRIGAATPVIVEIALVFLLCTSWLNAPRAGAPTFTESEATILLQAPISRRRMVFFSLMRVQPQMLLAALVIATIGARATPFYYAVPAIFLILNLGGTSGTAMMLLGAALANRGPAKWLAYGPGAALATLATLNLGMSYQEHSLGESGLAEIIPKLGVTLHSGPLAFVMEPFRLMAGLAAPADAADFAIRAGFVLGLIGLFGIMAWLLDSPWEEAAIARARKLGRWTEAFKQGRAMAAVPATEHARRTGFVLASQGPLWRAFAWKSMVSLTRQTSSRALIIILAVLVPSLAVGASMMSGGQRGTWAGPLVVISMMLVTLPLMAPALFPHDIRGEMQRLDLLKSFPVLGRDVMRGGVWACTAYVGFYQVVLLVVGVLVVTGPPTRPFAVMERVAVGALLLPVMPMLTALSFALEGAGAVLMPSWLMPRSQAGIEAAGRNMLLAVIRFVGGALCLIPVAAVTVPLGIILWRIGGISTLPVVGVVAGGLLWLEIEAIMGWAGGRLATLDPAQEQVQ